MSREEKEEMARGAILRLLRIAQAKIETGKSGEMPLDEISRAKSYVSIWEERAMISYPGLFFFVLHAITLFFFFTRKVGFAFAVLAAISLSALYFLYSIGMRRSEYIKDMIGDMSNLKKEQRDLYVCGLRYELWGISSEPIMYGKIMLGTLLVLTGLFLREYFEQGAIGLMITGAGLAAIYIGGVYKTKWEREE